MMRALGMSERNPASSALMKKVVVVAISEHTILNLPSCARLAASLINLIGAEVDNFKHAFQLLVRWNAG